MLDIFHNTILALYEVWRGAFVLQGIVYNLSSGKSPLSMSILLNMHFLSGVKYEQNKTER
jgi:hypothetical protein